MRKQIILPLTIILKNVYNLALQQLEIRDEVVA